MCIKLNVLKVLLYLRYDTSITANDIAKIIFVPAVLMNRSCEGTVTEESQEPLQIYHEPFAAQYLIWRETGLSNVKMT